MHQRPPRTCHGPLAAVVARPPHSAPRRRRPHSYAHAGWARVWGLGFRVWCALSRVHRNTRTSQHVANARRARRFRPARKCGNTTVRRARRWQRRAQVPEAVTRALQRSKCGEDLDDAAREALRFPLSAGEAHADLDHKGERCLVYDCVFNQDVVRWQLGLSIGGGGGTSLSRRRRSSRSRSPLLPRDAHRMPLWVQRHCIVSSLYAVQPPAQAALHCRDVSTIGPSLVLADSAITPIGS
jgi:PIH1 N-terminal domain